MKVAVIGSGAAAYGVVHSLLKMSPIPEIVLFDIGIENPKSNLMGKHPATWTTHDHVKINQYSGRRPIIPPITDFGHSISKYQVGKKNAVWKSEQFGGLLNFWSSSSFPLSEYDFKGWPISRNQLDPYYAEISDEMGITEGGNDGLLKYFKNDFSNRPPIKCSEHLKHLGKIVESANEKSEDFDVIWGVNRLGVETRSQESNSCVYCGECLSGCFRGSVFKTQTSFKKHISHQRLKFIKGKVLAVSGNTGNLEISTPDNKYSGFEKVFIGAGCPGTTEIVLRSFPKFKSLTMVDNDSYIFPLIYWGRSKGQLSADRSEYLSIGNVILGAVPKKEDRFFCQAHISPFPNKLFRYYLPRFLWGAFEGFGNWLRGRIFFAKVYLHSDVSRSYKLSLDEQSQLKLELIENSRSMPHLKLVLNAFRKTLSGSGYSILPWPIFLPKTSSHYAGTLSYKKFVNDNGEIAPGIYICDSSVFPNSPAQPLTFSIMANASRIAREAFS